MERDSQDRPDDQRLLEIALNSRGPRIYRFDIHPAYFNDDPSPPFYGEGRNMKAECILLRSRLTLGDLPPRSA